jgi:hypothetical protein
MLGSSDAKGAGDPPAESSAGRAMVNVEEVAGEPHPVGSAAMADVADYLAAALERTGAEVDRQDVGDLHNVVARIRGTNSTGVTCGLVRCAPPPSAWASFGATEVVQHPCPIGEHPGCLTVTDCWARGRTCWHIAQRSLAAADGPLELNVEGRPSGEPLQQPRQQRGPTTPNAARSARAAGPGRRTVLDPHGRTSACYGSEGWGFESLRARTICVHMWT